VLTAFSLAKVVEASAAQAAAAKSAESAGKERAGKERAGKKRKHDKGGAADKSGAAVHTSAMGTPTYTAPEIVAGGNDIGEIWGDTQGDRRRWERLRPG
jgi:hypothetical protein